MTDDRAPGRPVRYVALGDSYTIGTSVESEERFPNQLVALIDRLDLVANLGVNGYTSADLFRDELPALDALDPGFVTVLIGVNDVVQGVALERYEANVVAILDGLLAGLAADRVVVLTVPDYTVTPAGADYGDPLERSEAIQAANVTMTRLAGERRIAVVDIFDISLAAAADPTLVARDGLHPSGAQYGRWVERLVPVVRDRLA